MVQTILNYILSHILEIITILIATYWAILSTFNYFNNIWWLKVNFHYSVFQRWFFKFKKDNSKMILSIVNIWNQIEIIQSIWFYVDKDKVSLINLIDKMVVWKITILPKKINPSERVVVQFNKKEVLKFFEKNNLTPIFIWVWVTSWKVYKVKFNFNQIK